MAESTVKLVALLAPNLTAEAPVKSVPAIITDVPPAAVPEFGLIEVTVGTGGLTVTVALPGEKLVPAIASDADA